MSPVQNRMAPGQEPFAVFVATGEAGTGDLYAVRADGSPNVPITYTRVREMAPALSPSGTDLAFIREEVRGDPASRRVVVMNLLNGNERTVPPGEVPPDAVAWSADGTLLYIRAGGTTTATDAPPADFSVRQLGAADAARADSAFMVLVGTPAFAQVVDCPEGGVCVLEPGGALSALAVDGRGPVRWGSDSVGYFVGNSFFVRPLGQGRARELRLTPPRVEPRELTFSPGPAGPAPQ